MKEKLSNKQINVAIKWWGDVICNPKHDNGDDSTQGVMTSVLAVRATQEISEKQKDAFKEELAGLLKNESSFHGFHCEYGADTTLSKAMQKANIPEMNAPWKTNMNFHDGGVTVRYGYGAESETLLNRDNHTMGFREWARRLLKKR